MSEILKPFKKRAGVYYQVWKLEAKPKVFKPDNTPREGLPYKSGGDARRKIQIKPIRETSVGVAQA